MSHKKSHQIKLLYSPWKVGIGVTGGVRLYHRVLQANIAGAHRRSSPATPGVAGERRQSHRELQADQSEATKSIATNQNAIRCK